MNQARKVATLALTVMMVSAVVGWVLYIVGLYTDIAVIAGIPSDSLYGDEAIPLLYPSKFFFFAAIATVAFASLFARRKMLLSQGNTAAASRLTAPVRAFATTMMIISLALAAVVAVSGFMVSFSDTRNRASTLLRAVDAYLPIVLYTALIVTVLLYGFVFTRHHQQPVKHASVSPAPSEPAFSAPDRLESVQRRIGLAFAIPIIAVAVALVLGLIVYDLTQTSLEVWIWVIILTIIAAGIVLGTVNASLASKSLSVARIRPTGTVVGASNLSFVLSIVFAITVAIMSLSFGASAVNQLRVQHSLSLSVYFEGGIQQEANPKQVDLSTASISASGSSLESGSEATLSLEPTNLVITQKQVSSSGNFYSDATFPSDAPTGDLVIRLDATDSGGSQLSLELPVTINSDGTGTFTEGTDEFSSADAAELGQISVNWLLSDFLPALMHILLAVATIFVTLTVRNRDQ